MCVGGYYRPVPYSQSCHRQSVDQPREIEAPYKQLVYNKIATQSACNSRAVFASRRPLIRSINGKAGRIGAGIEASRDSACIRPITSFHSSKFTGSSASLSPDQPAPFTISIAFPWLFDRYDFEEVARVHVVKRVATASIRKPSQLY